MTTLLTRIPDVDVLLALPTEELALVLLQLSREHLQGNGLIHFQSIESQMQGQPPNYNGYPQHKKNDAILALAESWNWLNVQGLIIPEPGPNGNNGWMRLSRRATQLLNEQDFRSYAQSVAFPKSLLHPLIADDVWLDLARGDLTTAVFRAFKSVEIAVREAAGLSNADIGVTLMQKAFHPENGPLTDMNQEAGERVALMKLFDGAVGSYKNPHSHRTVSLTENREAQEMVMLASHLLRIVDSRRLRQQSPSIL